MAVVGYARVSTTGQSLGVQLEQLKAAGCEKIFQEKESGAKRDRQQLEVMLDYIREGDLVVVTKLDRLARSIRDFWNIVGVIQEKKAYFKVLSVEGLDSSDKYGRLLISVLAAFADFERELLRERQADGIAEAKEKGVYKGRKPLSEEVQQKINELAAQGVKKAEIARQLGIGRTSVYEYLKAGA